MSATTKQARANLIDQMREYIPDELASNDEEIVLILTNALGANIIEMKKNAGILFIQQRQASLNGNQDQADAMVERLVDVKSDLARLHKDYMLLGGGDKSDEEE